MISSARRPSLAAAAAFSWLAAANASCRSRVMPTFSLCCSVEEAHGDVVERVGEAVVHHGVDQGGVPDAKAGAGARQEVRRLRHRLHPAGHHNVGVAGTDHLVSQVDRVETREADLVDGVRRDRHGDAAFDRGLARRDLALAGQEDLTHEHVVDWSGDTPARRRGLRDGESSQVHGREAGQCTRELSDGRASPCDMTASAIAAPPVPAGLVTSRKSHLLGHYRRVT